MKRINSTLVQLNGNYKRQNEGNTLFCLYFFFSLIKNNQANYSLNNPANCILLQKLTRYTLYSQKLYLLILKPLTGWLSDRIAMAITVDFIKEQNRNNGDVQVNGFSGSTRVGENTTVVPGDRFVVTTPFTVFKSKATGAEYIVVNLLDADNKPILDANSKNIGKMFYPSTLTKRRSIVNQDGTPTGETMSVEGSASTLAKNYPTVQKYMDAIAEQCAAGKVLVVKEGKQGLVLRYGTANQTQMTTFPVIDIE